MIRTVVQDIEMIDGPILAHEHLQLDLSRNKGSDNILGAGEEQSVINDLRATRAAYGLGLVADLSVPGSGRNAPALRRIAEQSGVAVVCATGFYWDPLPGIVADRSVVALRDIMVREIETGIDDTGLRCGVIKIGTDAGAPDAQVEKLFRAAAAAARLTGACIVTHTSKPEQAFWQVQCLQSEAVPLSRVLVSHLHKLGDFGDLVRLAETGVYLGFDQLGFKKGPSIDAVADMVARIIEMGFGGQVILSSDIARQSRLIDNGGIGYATVFSEFLPLLRQRNVPGTLIRKLLGDNPARILSLQQASIETNKELSHG